MPGRKKAVDDVLATALLAAVDGNADDALTDAKTADAKAVAGLATVAKADKETAVDAFNFKAVDDKAVKALADANTAADKAFAGVAAAKNADDKAVAGLAAVSSQGSQQQS
jgi:hypothetical protein